jgi:hypothetical protein
MARATMHRGPPQSTKSSVTGWRKLRKLPSAARAARRAEPVNGVSRTPGLQRNVRDLYRLISTIRAEDLTSADRVALSALFKALVAENECPGQKPR